MGKKQDKTWSSAHRHNNTMVMSAEERHVANMNAREILIGLLAQFANTKLEEEEAKEEPEEECKGAFPNEEYPQPPDLEEHTPNDLPPAEKQEPPSEDQGYCPHCGNSPCLFLQWQEELEPIIDIMYSKVTNKAKRFYMYWHM
jgi:hypothetical protein